MSHFRSGEDAVISSDFPKVLDLLKAQSRWQPYLLNNLRAVQDGSMPWTFEVLRDAEFKDRVPHADRSEGKVYGITYKAISKVYLRETPLNSATSFVLAALHECVHVVSHPIAITPNGSTAKRILSDGLLEGLVELVTEDIILANKIPLPLLSSGLRGHQALMPIAQALLDVVGVLPLASLLFYGLQSEISKQFAFLFGSDDWIRIATYAHNQKTQEAISLIKSSSTARSNERWGEASKRSSNIQRGIMGYRR
jgi:hypothetical protein